MKAVHLTMYGDPLLGYKQVDIDEPPPPGPDQALVQVEFSPINISDFLLARGTYPTRPELPSVVGNEGVGRVLAVGAGVSSLRAGDKVLLPYAHFAWAERVVAPASALVVLPTAIDMQQAAMARINPTTGYLLATQIIRLERGSWLVQNAGNSGVGRAVIAMAKAAGLRTVSLVRRTEVVSELMEAGGDVVLLDSSEAPALIRRQTAGEEIRLALDGVGGRGTITLASVLGKNGTMVSYATMGGGEPIHVNFGDVGKRILLRGFFMFSPEFLAKHQDALELGIQMITDGRISTPVAAIYPLSEITQAATHVQRGGKVLLDLRS